MEMNSKKLNQDEQEIFEAFEQGEYESVLTEKRKQNLEIVGKNYPRTSNS